MEESFNIARLESSFWSNEVRLWLLVDLSVELVPNPLVSLFLGHNIHCRRWVHKSL